MEVVVGQFLQERTRLENEGGKDDLRHTHLVESQVSNSKRHSLSARDEKGSANMREPNIDFLPFS